MDTRALRDSTRAELNEEDPDGLTALIGSDVEYALYLELGTARMGARPWLRNTFAGELDTMKQTAIAGLGTEN